MKLHRIHKTHSRLVTNRSYFSDKRIGILIIASLFLNFAFISLTKNCFSSAMVFIVEEGVLTKSQTGVITSSFYVIYGVLQIVGGLLADRWHPERLITIGFLGAGIANLVIYLNQSYAVMLFAWIFNAFTQFPVWPCIFKIISSMVEPSIRKKGMFLMTFATSTGLVFGYVMAAIVSRWQQNFLISAVGLISLAIIWSLVWKFSTIKSEMVLNEHEAPTVPHHDEHPHFKLLPAVFKSGYIYVIFFNLIANVFVIGVKSFVPSIIKESYDNVSSSFATIISIIVLITGALGSVFAKLWYPKPFKNEISVFAAAFTVALIPCGIVLFVGKVNYWIIIGAMALLMVVIASSNLYYSYISAYFSRWGKSGTVSGITNFAASFGVVFANLILTRIADAFGWTVTLIVCFALLLIGAILAYIAAPKWAKFKRNDE